MILTDQEKAALRLERDRRLAHALGVAHASALGMPTSVETMKALLERAGLALVLLEETR